VQELVNQHPELFKQTELLLKKKGNEKWMAELAEGERFQEQGFQKLTDDRTEEWDGAPENSFGLDEAEIAAVPNGSQSSADALSSAEVDELVKSHEAMKAQKGDIFSKNISVERSPPLEANHVSEIEEKIGAGLIEEVIQVAEGELKLVDQMLESKVWEDLAEKPAAGQWEYFQRAQHSDST